MQRLIPNSKLYDAWQQRSTDTAYSSYLGSYYRAGESGWPLNDPHGSFRQHHTGYLAVGNLLALLRDELIDRDAYMRAVKRDIFSQENLWIREFVRLTRERTVVDAGTNAKLNDYLALERKWLIEDFKKLPPDLVLVDNLRNDWGAWARADAEVSQLLNSYTRVRSVEGIDILRRKE